MLGGKLFTRVPSFVDALEEKNIAAPKYAMVNNVMSLFFPEDVARFLSNSIDLIIGTTYELIQSHKAWNSELPYNVVAISFELLSMISDRKENFKNWISTCFWANELPNECYDLFHFAAKHHQKLPENALHELVMYVLDD